MTLHYGPRTDQFCEETFEVEEDTMNDKEMTVEMIAESIVDEIRGEYTKRRPPFDEAVALLAETLTKYEQRGYRLGQEDVAKLADEMNVTADAEVDYPGAISCTETRPFSWHIRALPISPQPQQGVKREHPRNPRLENVRSQTIHERLKGREPQQEAKPDDR